MKTMKLNGVGQFPLAKLLFNHFYIGVIITVFYALASPWLVEQGWPGISTLLLAEVVVLAPLGLFHLYWHARQETGTYSLNKVVLFRNKLPVKSLVIWSIGGIIACLAVYVPFYPLGLYLRETVFAWLPGWYFDPGFGTSDTDLIAKVFLVGIFIDGLLGPIVEELFFRSYLLPRMAWLKQWAPVLNGALFGLYHFWQPHNVLPLMAIGIILSYIVWKKKNVYLGIIIHCSINVLGAVAGYLAASGGVIIGR